MQFTMATNAKKLTSTPHQLRRVSRVLNPRSSHPPRTTAGHSLFSSTAIQGCDRCSEAHCSSTATDDEPQSTRGGTSPAGLLVFADVLAVERAVASSPLDKARAGGTTRC
jgi:hypothetical protein